MTIPLSLYIHFPWCVKKCPYCDFNSHEAQGTIPEAEYINALEKDLLRDIGSSARLSHQDRTIKSIFLGGGTPSLFSADSMSDLFMRLRKHLDFTDDIEITLEANPGTIDYPKFAGYFDAGINRLSMGVQSFNNHHLQGLGRIHSSNEVLLAYDAAIRAGFRNINLDLMHGLSAQSIDQAMNDLSQAIELKPTHLSWYQLTIEPNTQFYKQPPILPPEDDLWDIYTDGLKLLENNGFSRYEVSAFSQANKRAQHNLNYWHFGDYLGIGAGAHGKITERDGIERTAKTRLPKDYLLEQKSKTTRIPANELVSEFLMNALRLTDGFSTSLFEQRTDLPITALDSFLAKAEERALITREINQIMPTNLGLQYLNEMLLLTD